MNGVVYAEMRYAPELFFEGGLTLLPGPSWPVRDHLPPHAAVPAHRGQRRSYRRRRSPHRRRPVGTHEATTCG